jgi:hypothetical protein
MEYKDTIQRFVKPAANANLPISLKDRFATCP